MTPNLQSPETSNLLVAILDELKNIRCELKRQDEQIRLVSQSVPISQGHIAGKKQNPEFHGSSSHVPESTGYSLSLSTEMREGPILREAIRRYNSNCVPPYDHTDRPGKPLNVREKDLVKEDWTSVLGSCSQIPNDNRLLFSFQASELNMMSVEEVRQILVRLNMFHETNLSISDHFDTGLCHMYQFMRKDQGSAFQQKLPEALSQSHTNGQMGSLPPSDIAPWRRVITIRGLAIGSLEIEEKFPRGAHHTRCPYFSTRPISDDSDSNQHKWVLENKLMWRAVDHHLRCARLYEHEYSDREWKLSRCVLFHVTFWEVMAAKPHRSTENLWRVGKLHSHRDLNRPGFVRNSACTVFAIPSNDTQRIKTRTPYWTILWLLPWECNFTEYRENRDDMKSGRYNDMLHEMGYFVLETLKKLVASWRELAHYFDVLVGEGSAFLNPDYHDSLLTDDATFSRSKKYFWAIKFLKEAEVNIADNLKQLQKFMDLVMKTPLAPEQVRLRDKQMNEHRENIRRLEELKASFRDKREEVVALRDGLFSASAVIESRASTQLGENIKLLTFVSIFFLPLSFVMSVWSINNSIFSLSSLTIVVIVVALSTYFIVFNLNNLVYVTRGTFRSIARHHIEIMVEQMKQDPRIVWRKRGKAFEKFRVEIEAEHKPSNWRLIQYALRLGWKTVWPWKSGGREKDEVKSA